MATATRCASCARAPPTCAPAKKIQRLPNPQGRCASLPRTLPWSVVAATSIIGLNMSLMLNTIGFYQVQARDPDHVCPFGLLLGKGFAGGIQAIVVVLLGVGVATVSDVEMNAGPIAAIVGVSTSMQQILVAHLQRSTASEQLSPQNLSVHGGLDAALDRDGRDDPGMGVRHSPTAVALLVPFLCGSPFPHLLVLCIGRFSACRPGHRHARRALCSSSGGSSSPHHGANIMGCCLAVVGMIATAAVTLPAAPIAGNNLLPLSTPIT